MPKQAVPVAGEAMPAASTLKQLAAMLRSGDFQGALALAEGSNGAQPPRPDKPNIDINNTLLSFELRTVLQAHASARQDLNDKCKFIDDKELGRPVTSKDEAIWNKASRVEEGTLLAVCSFRAHNDADRAAKAAYLLDFGAHAELHPEHMEALLQSILDAPATESKWRSAFYDLESEIHDAVRMANVLSDLMFELFQCIEDGRNDHRIDEWSGEKALFLGNQVLDKAKAVLSVWTEAHARATA